MLPPLIPLETLFGNPTYARPTVSPDGRWLGYIAPAEGVLNVWIRPTNGGEPRQITHDSGRGIRAYAWPQDGKHLLYIQDRDGDENWHLYAVCIDSENVRDLTPFENIQAQIVGVEPNVPDRVAIATNQRNEGLHDVYVVTLSSGALEMVEENPGDVVGWVTDADLVVRAALAQTPQGGWDIRARATGDAPWASVHTVGPDDEAAPHGFTEDGKGLYILTSRGFNTAHLCLLDLQTGALTDLAGRDDVDVSDSVFHPTEHRLQAVAFDRARTEWTVLDDAIKSDMELLQTSEDGDLDVGARSNDDTLWIAATTRDRGSAAYGLYHRGEKRLERLFTGRPELDAYTLAPMQPVDITARDGLVLPSYLTLPVDMEPERLPMVLNVHGGPWSRDGWGLDPEAQWFANRGYACLQVNFRASSGFGKSFLHAGDREWGGKMLDDLVDAVQWAVDCGVADPARVAVYGGSYGGYAVLSALAFRPEVFACGVDIVGPSNLLTFLNSIPAYWEPMRKLLDQRVGRAVEDEEFLRSRSPFFHVENIVRPLFVAQGANDPRVVKAESDQVVGALRDAGKPVEYMVFEDEGHGFARPENRLKFYEAAESFLSRYLGGRTA